MRSNISLTALVAFDLVARHLSFSQAARDLHITQGAVSHRIRLLEEELGVSLFTRTSRRVQLTDSGKVLASATHDAFSILDSGLEDATSEGNRSRLTVSCSPSFAVRWLVPHLASLRAHAPSVRVHISAEDELVDPGVGAIDLCVRFGGGGYSGFHTEQLVSESITPVCSPLYARTMQLSSPTDLSRCMLLHDDVLTEHPAHIGWREWLAEAGVPGPKDDGLHFSHSHLALDAAVAGQGIALGRKTLTAADRAAERLVSPFDLALDSALTYWLITPKIARRRTAIDAFRTWLVSALEEGAASDQPRNTA